MTMVRNGDQDAFSQLFDRYFNTVRGVARGVLRDPEDVADVIQETFLDVFHNARTFDASKGALKTWICCLAYHRSVKRLRALKARIWQSYDIEQGSADVEAGFRPENLIHAMDFRKCLETVFADLNERQRQTMKRYFFEGQELNEIAQDLGETLGNTRHHLYRGLRKLRSELEQKRLLAGYIEFETTEGKRKTGT